MTLHSAPVGEAALVLDEAGREVVPDGPDAWDAWVSAGRTRNYCDDDPLLDWLHRFGRDRGFLPDDEAESFDPRTDLRAFVLERGLRFEEAVVGLIREGLPTVRIAHHGWEDARDLERARETVRAMRDGVPVIEQAVLRDPASRTYGAVDLLVRSDHLDRIVPDTLARDEARLGAPGLGPQAWHYRVVDIKFHTFGLLKDGHAGTGDLAYMAQVCVYNRALGRIQGYRPPSAYLLGRSWHGSADRGEGCFERLARVDDDHYLENRERSLGQIVEAAVEWVRRVRREGGSWEVLPIPSVPELYPHARNSRDAPWHSTKAYLAERLAELTLLPAMNPTRRAAAHRRGLRRWDDPRVEPAVLGLKGSFAEKCRAVLDANRSRGPEVVFPARIVRADPAWREPADLEFYVDFETVSNLADDFTALPRIGGQPLIFQIGCGHWEAGTWRFAQWTVDRLDETHEAEIIAAWLAHLRTVCDERGVALEQARLVHWSPAETSSLENAYDSAGQRHPELAFPALPWFDALQQVIRAEPVTVRGAFGFGLKAIAKAMHAHGLIATSWEDGPTDGLGAMVGAWWCDGEAARVGGSMLDQPLMQEIGRYNEVDCRTMAEVLAWLRAHR